MPSGSNTLSRSNSLGIQRRCVIPHSLQPQLRPQPPPQQQQQQRQEQNRQAVQEQQQRRLSQSNDVSDACRYLYRHSIHTKVESIFSSLLTDRPEDPLIYILDYLHKKHGKLIVDETDNEHGIDNSMTIIVSQKKAQQPSQLTPALSENGDLIGKDLCLHGGVVEVPSGGENPLTNVEGESRRHFLPHLQFASLDDAPMPVEVDMPLISSIAGNGKSTTSSAEPCMQPIQRSIGTARPVACFMRPSSSLLMLRTSQRSSCNDVSYSSAALRFGGTFPETQVTGVGGSAVLDREDSTRSDLSTFSLASVDIQDFLQEFRSAKVDCVGVETRLVDIDTVSDILQRITIPLPDISLIAELFDDVKKINDMRYSSSSVVLGEEENNAKDRQTTVTKIAVSSFSTTVTEAGTRERVYFDAFLARMAFMIQGRYPTELIRDTFYFILDHGILRKRSADGGGRQYPYKKVHHHHQVSLQQQQQQQSRGTVEGGQHVRTSSGSAYTKSFGLPTKNIYKNENNACMGSAGSYTATATRARTSSGLSLSFSALCAAPSANHPAAGPSALLRGVPLSVCVEEGLWRGLGIPCTGAEVTSTLRALGIPDDDGYDLHVNDFVRLVAALTGHGSVNSIGDKGSLLMVSSFGRDGTIMPLNRSLTDDSA